MGVISCCGQRVYSAFCPSCGKKLRESIPLLTLLLHVKSKAIIERRKYNRRMDMFPGRDFKRHKAIVDKWEGWVAAIEEVLNNQGSDDADE